MRAYSFRQPLSSLISFLSHFQKRLVKLKNLGPLFLEYKRLGGSLNRQGRATGGLWLKRPTDLLGEEKNAWRLEKSIGDCRPLGGIKPQVAWHSANDASPREVEIESKSQATASHKGHKSDLIRL